MTKPFTYLSVCSGIEAASVAWHPLGWRPAAFAEIDPFACHVLAHRQRATRPLFMPDPTAAPGFVERRKRLAAIKAVTGLPDPSTPHLTPNFGDLEAWRTWPDAAFDLLVGGTPCQSFSVAGLRQGLDDPRGNLALVYLGVADRYRPRWLVWENVPGVLSSGRGRDFGAFLGGLGELGYGWAYRVLDSQKGDRNGRLVGSARLALQHAFTLWPAAAAMPRWALCQHPERPTQLVAFSAVRARVASGPNPRSRGAPVAAPAELKLRGPSDAAGVSASQVGMLSKRSH